MDPFIVGDVQVVKTKRCDKILIAMAFINFIVGPAISYIVPFFPVLASEKAGLNYTTIGLLLSFNAIGSTLSAYIFGARIQLWGRRKFYLMSLFSQSIVMVLYGSLYFMTDDYWLFLGVSTFTRVFEGVMRAVYNVTTNTYLNILWEDKSGFARRFSIMEAVSSSGQIFGLIFGSLVNYTFGYYVPLFGIAVLFILCVIVACIFIPHDDTIVQTSQKQKAKLPIKLAFQYKASLITFLTLVGTRAAVRYYLSFFSHHMLSYNISNNYAALMISIPQLAYIFAMPIIPLVLKADKNFEFMFSFSVLLSSVGIAIISPVWSDGEEFNHIWIALILIGIGSALSRIPAIPVMILSLQKIDIPGTDRSGLSDIASALFQMHISITNLIFPIIGGGLYDQFGGQSGDFTEEREAFRFTMMCLFVVLIILFFFDLIMNDRWRVWQSTFCKKRNEGQMILEKEKEQDKTFFESTYSNSDNLTADKIATTTLKSHSVNDIKRESY